MIFTIDPGLSALPGGTGWALFYEGSNNLMPLSTGIISPKGIEWEERADNVIYQLNILLNAFIEEAYDAFSIYIELPTFFQSSKGMSCATGKDGQDSDLIKLATLVGRIYQLGLSKEFINLEKVSYLRVNEWKGTLSKEAVKSRIARRYQVKPEKLPFKSHALDAVGMGLYVKGVFQVNPPVRNIRNGKG